MIKPCCQALSAHILVTTLDEFAVAGQERPVFIDLRLAPPPGFDLPSTRRRGSWARVWRRLVKNSRKDTIEPTHSITQGGDGARRAANGAETEQKPAQTALSVRRPSDMFREFGRG